MKLVFFIIAAIVILFFLGSIADGFLAFTASIKNSAFAFPLIVIVGIIILYNEYKKDKKNGENDQEDNK